MNSLRKNINVMLLVNENLNNLSNSNQDFKSLMLFTKRIFCRPVFHRITNERVEIWLPKHLYQLMVNRSLCFEYLKMSIGFGKESVYNGILILC